MDAVRDLRDPEADPELIRILIQRLPREESSHFRAELLERKHTPAPRTRTTRRPTTVAELDWGSALAGL